MQKNNYLLVIKNILFILIGIVIFLLLCKMTLFYIPFLIAFIISTLVEPIIKFINRKFSITRKSSSIIVLVTVFVLIIIVLTIGIINLISETTNLLNGFNLYLDKTIVLISDIESRLKINELNIPNEVKNIIENMANDYIKQIANYLKELLNKILSYITKIPNMFINIIITILATYFITSDKFYILDRLEHHLSKKMMGKVITHTKEITSSLGSYLKAEITLSIITFMVVLTGLNIFYLVGMDVEYPILIALLIGFVDALPILGAGSVMLPWFIILLINKEISLGFSILGLYIFIVVLKQIIEPKLVSKNIGIHPIFTLVSMYTGFKIVGILGLLLGPILLIILKNIFSEILDKGLLSSIIEN